MKVTVVFNHFGPVLIERMPSAGPVIRSEGNRFVAPNEECKKKVTWHGNPNGNRWLWKSVRDSFQN
ncbi:hypothetical protein SUGI_0566630 [Cryptomeria japonica]|nr:hypothetical protein SUGI_0566630 [Cryptomeria japonica]